MLPSLGRLNANVGAFENHLNELPENLFDLVSDQKLQVAVDALDTATILRTCATSTAFQNACKRYDWDLELQRMFGKWYYDPMYVESEPTRNFITMDLRRKAFTDGIQEADLIPDAYIGMRAFILIAEDLKRNCSNDLDLDLKGGRVPDIGRKSVYFAEATEPPNPRPGERVKQQLDDFIFLVRGGSVRFGYQNIMFRAWYDDRMDRLMREPPQLARVVHALLPYVARSQSNRLEVAFLLSLGLSNEARKTASSYDQDVYDNVVSVGMMEWRGAINPRLVDIIAPLLRPEAWIYPLYKLANTNVERAKALFNAYPMAREANRSAWLRHLNGEWQAFVWKERPLIIRGVKSGFIPMNSQEPPTLSEVNELDKM